MIMEIPNQPQQIIQDTNKDKTEFVISKFIKRAKNTRDFSREMNWRE